MTQLCHAALIIMRIFLATTPGNSALPDERYVTVLLPPEAPLSSVDISSDGRIDKPPKTDVVTNFFTVSFNDDPNARLLIYCPGYKMVAVDFAHLGFTDNQIYRPVLERLTTTAFKGRLVDSQRKPLPNKKVYLKYHLMEMMRFFGYIDGQVRMLAIGSSKTDNTGAFSFDVPRFADDSFFQKYHDLPGQFYLSMRDSISLVDDTLSLDSIPMRSEYPGISVITRTLHGTLAGKLGHAFLRKNGLQGDLTPYIRSIDSVPFSIRLDAEVIGGRRSYSASLKPDGTFEIELPPGSYDLRLLILGPGFVPKDRIEVRNRIDVKESQRVSISRDE